MANTTKTKESTNYAFKIVGYLGHDNLLFDRACANGCKGFFSSREHRVCPKCGGQLTWILSKGKPIAISEGTIYPAMSEKQKAKDAEEIKKRKNGMPIRYRFKMFSFADENGVLMPPPEHDRCMKRAKVEVMIINHQVIPSWFLSKPDKNGNKEVWVEFLLMVYTNYGDKVKVLTDEEYIQKVTTYDVLPNGDPAPIEMPVSATPAPAASTAPAANDARIDELDAKINKIQDMLMKALSGDTQAPQTPATPQAPIEQAVAQTDPVQPDTAPWDDMPNADYDKIDPFLNAV